MANILLGVTGGIAAYKAADLCSALIRSGHTVKVIMTETAKKFITPLTLATMSQGPVYDDASEWATIGAAGYDIKHITLSKWADMLLVAPATAKLGATIAKTLASEDVEVTYLHGKGAVMPNQAYNEMEKIEDACRRPRLQRLQRRLYRRRRTGKNKDEDNSVRHFLTQEVPERLNHSPRK